MRVSTAIAALLLVSVASVAAADDDDAIDASNDSAGGDPSQHNYSWMMIPETLFEVAVLRPLGAAATAAGLPMFIASVPFMAPSRELGWSWDVFVQAPFDYTFTRPFRDF